MLESAKSKRPVGSRYAVSSGTEGDWQPGSRERVLRNRLGVIGKREMDRLEYEALLKMQGAWLEKVGTDTRFTATMICEMHRDWLDGIYEWAGRYRTVEMQKGNFRWPPAYLVDRNMAELERGVLCQLTPCIGGSVEGVAMQLAQVHAELLLVHPFRDGNGRIARWVADLMAMQAGYPAPAYHFSGRGARKEKQEYLQAVTRGYVRDYGRLADFFAAALRRRLGRG